MAEISVNSNSIDMVSTGVIKMLDSLMTQNLVEERHIRKAIYHIEANVKKAVQSALVASLSNGKLYTKTKSAHVHYLHVEKAVKMSIYKKILGANVSLYNNKRKRFSFREMPYQGRYNPRRWRCRKTIQAQEGYDTWPETIERFINNGTANRKTGFAQHYYMGRNTGENWLGAGYDRFGNAKSGRATSWSTGRIGGSHFFDVAKTYQRTAGVELAIRINKILEEINREFQNS